MNFVISANYRDRDSSYRYLIRKEGEPLSSARACKSVVCEDAQVMYSGEEKGFGCSTVIVARNAIGLNYEDEAGSLGKDTLKFSFDRFKNKMMNTIRSAKRVNLPETGKILSEGGSSHDKVYLSEDDLNRFVATEYGEYID